MIKRFHEAPKSIFKQVQEATDGDYALVHLFEEDEEYYNLFAEAVAQGREVILDNSIFELGTAFDPDKFAQWIRKLQPTYYIIPDVLEDREGTVKSLMSFLRKYPDLPGKVMGVVQGKDYAEFTKCYLEIEPYCDRIGISFDCSWYKDFAPSVDKWEQYAYGRLMTLVQMERDHVINPYKEHHLLGVALPQEMEQYSLSQKGHKLRFVTSVDTSNPVVHGLKGIRYTTKGLDKKETQKLYTMINEQVTPEQLDDIMFNIEGFRRFC